MMIGLLLLHGRMGTMADRGNDEYSQWDIGIGSLSGPSPDLVSFRYAWDVSRYPTGNASASSSKPQTISLTDPFMVILPAGSKGEWGFPLVVNIDVIATKLHHKSTLTV